MVVDQESSNQHGTIRNTGETRQASICDICACVPAPRVHTCEGTHATAVDLFDEAGKGVRRAAQRLIVVSVNYEKVEWVEFFIKGWSKVIILFNDAAKAI